MENSQWEQAVGPLFKKKDEEKKNFSPHSNPVMLKKTKLKQILPLVSLCYPQSDYLGMMDMRKQ